MRYSMTINTDASFDPETKTAGWAYWIKSHDQLFKDSGYMGRVDNPSIAELVTIGKAVDKVREFVQSEWGENFPEDQIKLYINTDSTWSISAIEGRFRKSKHMSFVRAIQHKLGDFDIEARHVKAHKHTETARHWVNDWCDKQAKKQLRAALKGK